MNYICLNIRKIEKNKMFLFAIRIARLYYTFFQRNMYKKIKINTIYLIFILQRLLDIFIVKK